MKGAELLPALAVLRGDQQNIRKVWALLAREDRFDAIERTLPLVILLHDLNGIAAEAPEVEALLKDLIARLKAAVVALPDEPALRGSLGLALAGLRRFSIGQAQEDVMKAYRSEALGVLEGVPLTSTKAYALLLCAFSPGKISEQEAKDLCGQAASAMEALGDDFGAALAYEIQGDALLFDFQSAEQAEASYRKALERFEMLRSDWGRGLCLYGLGLILYRKGELDAAYRAMKGSLEIHERINDPDRAMLARSSAGDLALALGYRDEARRFYETNLSYFLALGNAGAVDHFRSKLKDL